MAWLTEFGFNPAPATVMHLDINSCFATIEQQANPLLRGKPIAVAAYNTPNGCLLAPSVEAKKLGLKVGMRVREGLLLCPDLIVLTPDPEKYRSVHHSLEKILSQYTSVVIPKSIDEFVLDFSGTPAFTRGLSIIALEIKRRLKEELGECLTVSIGLAPNRFLAKTASNLHKPDGLDEINKSNFLKVYQQLSLTDLTGIARSSSLHLNKAGIYTVLDFLQADLQTLHLAFSSISGYHWFQRLRGWEVDQTEWATKSFGHSYSLSKFLTKPADLAPILSKLVEKVGFRLRKSNFQARGVHLGLLFQDHQYWHQGSSFTQPIFLSQDIYRAAYCLLSQSPHHLPIRHLAVSCYGLVPGNSIQLGFFEDHLKKENLVKALDQINLRWGNFTITPATMVTAKDLVQDRISFGR